MDTGATHTLEQFETKYTPYQELQALLQQSQGARNILSRITKINEPSISRQLALKDWSWDLIHPRAIDQLKLSLQISALALMALALPSKFTHLWGISVLSTNAYAIINDLFACRTCPEYFTFGHYYDAERGRNRLVRSLDPNLNALAWGFLTTSTLAAIGGLAIAALANASNADEVGVIKFMLTYTVATFLIADLYSRFSSVIDVYPDVPSEFKARWHANNTRNSIGYLGLILGGLMLAVKIS